MLVACWSMKGGVGTTVVAVSLALQLARGSAAGVVLADLAGDAPVVLGLGEPDSPGLAGWLAAGPGVPADALARIEIEVGPGLGLLPRGHGELWPARGDVLAALLDRSPRVAVVDCGRLGSSVPGGGVAPHDLLRMADGRPVAPHDHSLAAGGGDAAPGPDAVAAGGCDGARQPLPVAAAGPDGPSDAPVAAAVVARAQHSLLVTRPCYVALRRAMQAPVRPTGVVLVNEPGRVLSASDVGEAARAPVVAQVEVDPKVARLVDAGLLTGRLPRSLDPLRSAA